MKVVNTANPGTASEDFVTGNLELSAFLLCTGIRWNSIQHVCFELIQFRFTDKPELRKAIGDFERGTGPYPPAKALFRALRLVRALADASNQIDAFIKDWRDYAGN